MGNRTPRSFIGRVSATVPRREYLGNSGRRGTVPVARAHWMVSGAFLSMGTRAVTSRLRGLGTLCEKSPSVGCIVLVLGVILQLEDLDFVPAVIRGSNGPWQQ